MNEIHEEPPPLVFQKFTERSVLSNYRFQTFSTSCIERNVFIYKAYLKYVSL